MENNQNEEEKQISKEEALESLKKDFGEEGLDTLLSGMDAMIDLTGKFEMPYDKMVGKMNEDDDAGLVRKVGDTIIAVEKVEKDATI
ncbi:MAG: hypothetical protein K8T10_04440 [Candidatus Eremiobacteraeota bacterium]|nr:hypothetical protein [Candidatus Eremiobacteraeota bacterium]